MKNIFTLLFVFSTILLFAQKKQIPTTHDGFHLHNGTICTIGEPMPGFVIPARAISRNPPQNPLIFEITYSPTVPPTARTAFERAGNILSNLFSSTVPITVQVNTDDDIGENTLAAAGAGRTLENFKNAPIPNTFYPIALAEKLAGENLSSVADAADIIVTYNPTRNWNFTSTNVTGSQLDFVTVILHELLHGMGFASSTSANSLSSRPLPNAYTNALENRAGENLVLVFNGLTNELSAQLSSNQLFIRTPTFDNSNDLPKVYAPPTYQSGSSISHLDEVTYRNTPNSLMKPSIAPGAIVHDPGDIALNILYDMGWSFSNVVHESAAGSEDTSIPYEVIANVISEHGYDPASIVLHYSQDTFRTETTVNMTATGNADEFIATIPAANEFTVIQYYISVNDSRNLQFSSPAGAPIPVYHTYLYQIDNTLPEITHEPVKIAGDADSEIPLDASVTDFFTGVDEVFIEYKINGANRPAVFMEKDTTDGFRPDLYAGAIPLTRFISEGDIIEYRIVANDKSNANNTIMSPADGGFHEVEISAIRAAVSAYVNDFEVDLIDFNGSGFSITNPIGFSDNAIHSIHPYTNAGENNTRNFNYDLSFPIIIRSTEALIEFEEVVLVEPSTAGTSFGDLEFWDYVIVEGRRLEEVEWFPFLDGYDSREHPAWLSAYNSSTQGQDSNAAGSNQLFRDRIIDMQANGNFSAGDTVVVRFRLFSDPFAVGWGWAIDNLRIQDTQVAIEDFVDNSDFKVFPNPVSDQLLTIKSTFKQPVSRVKVRIHSVHGQLLFQQAYDIQNKSFNEAIPINDLPKGVLLLTLDIDNKEQITRRILRH